MPFDRLVRTVDEWARAAGRKDVFAQIGSSAYRPRHLESVECLTPAEFRQRASSAALIISHAGVGSILTALELCKPVVVMPRRAALGEHRNDHQVATSQRFVNLANVRVAFNEEELLATLLALDFNEMTRSLAAYASPELLARIREFVRAAPARTRYWRR